MEKPYVFGRPSIYSNDYPQQLINFFCRDYTETVKVQRVFEGQVIEVEEERPRPIPTIEKFCANLLISKETFYRWLKEHEDLNDAFKLARQHQIDQIMNNAILKRYAEKFSIFLLTNISEYREKVETDVNIQPVKIEFVRPKND